MQEQIDPGSVDFRQKSDKVLQAAAEPINRPSHDDIELPACGRRVQGVKSRPFILALGAADAVISINVNDPPAGSATWRSSRS